MGGLILPPRPLEHLHDLSTRYPGAWRDFEQMRADRGTSLPDWPEWCYVPLAGAYAVVSGGGDNRVAPERGADIGRLAALAAWRMTKGVYRFDEDILAELWGTPLTGELPSELLLRLPEWCVYIETGGREVMGAALHGFYAHLESDANDGRRELRLLLDYEAGLLPQPVHLVGTLEQGLEQTAHETELQAALQGHDVNTLRAQLGHTASTNRQWAEATAPLISLLLYLCSERPDIGSHGRSKGAGAREPMPGNPQPKRVKGGERLFAAAGVRTWDVAYRLGAAFRQARATQVGVEGGAGRTVRPHVRKAHYHLYWTGQRGRQTSVLRWLPPITVKFDPEAELPVVVRKVGKET